jgi:hypothetical protein
VCRASIRYRRLDASVFLYAFDLIELNGDDLRRDPLAVRKATLASVLAKAARVRTCGAKALRDGAGRDISCTQAAKPNSRPPTDHRFESGAAGERAFLCYAEFGVTEAAS